MFSRFKDRREAGRKLTGELADYARRDDVVVLALPRGGVPVAYEVARGLDLPLDVFVVRKLGVPGQEELGFGAIGSGGARVVNYPLVRALRMTDEMIDRIVKREREELYRREKLYRGSAPMPEIQGKTVIIVDDGLATGATMRVAVEALKSQGARDIVVAVPAGSRETCSALRQLAHVVCVCAMTPEPFYGVGQWYEDFSQTSDDEVQDLLYRARSQRRPMKAA